MKGWPGSPPNPAPSSGRERGPLSDPLVLGGRRTGYATVRWRHGGDNGLHGRRRHWRPPDGVPGAGGGLCGAWGKQLESGGPAGIRSAQAVHRLPRHLPWKCVTTTDAHLLRVPYPAGQELTLRPTGWNPCTRRCRCRRWVCSLLTLRPLRLA